MNYTALSAEVVGDPEAIGYSGMTNADVVASLKALTRSRGVSSVTGQEIFEAAVPGEYNDLDAAQKQLFLGIIGLGTILVNGTNTKAALLDMFVGGTTTRTNLAALQTEAISRETEESLGNVKEGHVQKVRA